MALDTSLTLTQLLSPPGLASLLTTIQSQLGINGFSATDWETDSDGRIILQVEAQTLADLWQAVYKIAQGGYLDIATGPWLDLLALSQYQITRKPAIQTIGNFLLSTIAGAGPYTFAAGDLVVSAAGIDGNTVVYRSTNAAPVTVNAGVATASIQMTADIPSANANIGSGKSSDNNTFVVTTPRPGLVISNPGVSLPATLQSGVTTGTYPLAGKSLQITCSINGGALVGPVTLTFPTNYSSLSAVSTALNNLISLSALNNLVTSFVLAGTLVIQTIHGAGASIVDTLQITVGGSALLILGFYHVPTLAVNGTFSWITQYGQDPEQDSALVTRCKSEWGVIGTGTKDAFISWSTTADPQTQRVIVYSNYFDGTPKSGAVTIYIAPTRGVFDPADAPSHVAAVYNYINPRMPIMSQLFVGPALGSGVTIAGDIYIKQGYDLATVNSAVVNSVEAYILGLSIGDKLIIDKLIAAIVDVDGVNDLVNLNQTVNLSPAKNQIFTLTSATFRNFSA